MTEGKLQIGQLVCSRAGRDKDSCYIIYSVLNDTFVQVIDGENRKIDKPKKKNVKHLRPLNHIAINLAEKIKLGEKITDAEIRRGLKSLG